MLIVCRKDLQFDALKVVFNKRNIHLLTHLTRMMIFKKKKVKKIKSMQNKNTNITQICPILFPCMVLSFLSFIYLNSLYKVYIPPSVYI